jgi:penicillin V acylase-like amidase (Ntn superfamily)
MYFKKGSVFFTWLVLFTGFIIFFAEGDALSCSRVLSADNGQAVLVGRNLDWPIDMGTGLWVFPRGIKRNGLAGNPLIWTTKYGSVAVASYAPSKKVAGVLDGMNEKGLAVNSLWLDESDYGVRDERTPGLAISMWAQYFLDNYATVEEALHSLDNITYQVVTMAFPTGTTTMTAYLHLSFADKNGDSAIIEYSGGKPHIHHDRNYTVMTNYPPYEKQMENLKQYEGFGGDKPLPGTIKSEDRFVRASYYLKYLPKPQNVREAIAGMFSVTRNASQPFRSTGDPKHPNASATIWRTVADLTHGTYYFELTTSPNIIWVKLNRFDLKKGSPVMKLDLFDNLDYAGDVAKKFKKAKPFKFMGPDQSLQPDHRN